MTLVYAGIDEAGYGPMLGPLCVGLAVLRVSGWTPGEPPPDVWSRLQRAVCRTAKDAKKTGRVPIADSKKLKGSNQLKTIHPLRHLERGVLAFVRTMGVEPTTDLELFDALGAKLEDHPWYRGEPIALPLGGTPAELHIATNVLRKELERTGVELLGLRCGVTGVNAFNELIRREHSKAATTEAALVEHLRFVRTHWGDEMTRIACDRQSGRQDYRGSLGRAWPDETIEVVEQSARASVYSADDGRLGVQLISEAEDWHFPVALASMCAKYVRELAMARFNRYWSERAAGRFELKPTAGYVQDARRWLDDAGELLTKDDRRAMIRTA